MSFSMTPADVAAANSKIRKRGNSDGGLGHQRRKTGGFGGLFDATVDPSSFAAPGKVGAAATTHGLTHALTQRTMDGRPAFTNVDGGALGPIRHHRPAVEKDTHPEDMNAKQILERFLTFREIPQKRFMEGDADKVTILSFFESLAEIANVEMAIPRRGRGTTRPGFTRRGHVMGAAGSGTPVRAAATDTRGGDTGIVEVASGVVTPPLAGSGAGAGAGAGTGDNKKARESIQKQEFRVRDARASLRGVQDLVKEMEEVLAEGLDEDLDITEDQVRATLQEQREKEKKLEDLLETEERVLQSVKRQLLTVNKKPTVAEPQMQPRVPRAPAIPHHVHRDTPAPEPLWIEINPKIHSAVSTTTAEVQSSLIHEAVAMDPRTDRNSTGLFSLITNPALVGPFKNYIVARLNTSNVANGRRQRYASDMSRYTEDLKYHRALLTIAFTTLGAGPGPRGAGAIYV